MISLNYLNIINFYDKIGIIFSNINNKKLVIYEKDKFSEILVKKNLIIFKFKNEFKLLDTIKNKLILLKFKINNFKIFTNKIIINDEYIYDLNEDKTIKNLNKNYKHFILNNDLFRYNLNNLEKQDNNKFKKVLKIKKINKINLINNKFLIIEAKLNIVVYNALDNKLLFEFKKLLKYSLLNNFLIIYDSNSYFIIIKFKNIIKIKFFHEKQLNFTFFKLFFKLNQNIFYKYTNKLFKSFYNIYEKILLKKLILFRNKWIDNYFIFYNENNILIYNIINFKLIFSYKFNDLLDINIYHKYIVLVSNNMIKILNFKKKLIYDINIKNIKWIKLFKHFIIIIKKENLKCLLYNILNKTKKVISYNISDLFFNDNKIFLINNDYKFKIFNLKIKKFSLINNYKRFNYLFY